MVAFSRVVGITDDETVFGFHCAEEAYGEDAVQAAHDGADNGIHAVYACEVDELNEYCECCLLPLYLCNRQ